jgi:hypothetical protein
MIKEKLPPDASKLMAIRLNKFDYDFIKQQYSSNPVYYRSFAGVIREGLNLLKARKPIKTGLNKGSQLWN